MDMAASMAPTGFMNTLKTPAAANIVAACPMDMVVPTVRTTGHTATGMAEESAFGVALPPQAMVATTHRLASTSDRGNDAVSRHDTPHAERWFTCHP